MPKKAKNEPKEQTVVKDSPKQPVMSSAPSYAGEESTKIKLSDLNNFHKHPFIIPDANDPEMKQLMSSIRTQGILNLPIVRHEGADPTKYEIISGHRRVEACRLNKYTEIPVKILDFDDNDATAFMVTSNISRLTKVSLLERVKSCSLLYGATLSKDGKNNKRIKEREVKNKVAEMLGITSSEVNSFLLLAKLSDNLLRLTGTKRFTIKAALAIAKIANNDDKSDDKSIEDLQVNKLKQVDSILVQILTSQENIILKKDICKKIAEAVKTVEISSITLEFINNIISTSTDNTTKAKLRNIIIPFKEISEYFAGKDDNTQIKKEIIEILKRSKQSTTEQASSNT